MAETVGVGPTYLASEASAFGRYAKSQRESGPARIRAEMSPVKADHNDCYMTGLKWWETRGSRSANPVCRTGIVTRRFVSHWPMLV